MNFKKRIIAEYHDNLKYANSEAARKELFKDLLVRLFDEDDSVRETIHQMSLGAEKVIVNIPCKSRFGTGYADTQYGKVIIEFKKDLMRSEADAKEQLKKYLAGNWESGQAYNFTLIASDCRKWIIYAPSYENIILSHSAELKETDRFVLDDSNAGSFFYFIDRYLFRTEKQAATMENVRRDFGETSSTFFNVTEILKARFDKVRDTPEIRTSFGQWHKFLSIAYGSFEASEEIFLVHTYLSIFSKMLAYTVLEQDQFADDEKLRGIISGDIFEQLNVVNFIDRDFYHWVASEDNFKALGPAFRKISEKIAQYDFAEVGEDILKGIYQGLVDLETRHALGEYYTPDWLCEKMVRHLKIRRNSTVLDPACGSGSFLRVVIDTLKKKYPDMSADEIVAHVAGIDIHPLSVQIAKNTVLLALGEKIRLARRPVNLRIFLANTLFAPKGSAEVFGDVYKPYFLRKSFDFVIGNPPWLTYKDVTNKDYQDELRELAHKYRLLPKIANMPHLELAAIFLSHSASYFLKSGGKTAFVLPRSFLTADHHDNTRAGKAEGFRIRSVWDLKDVSPLFRVPSCVFFSEKAKSRHKHGKIESIRGLKISGRIGYSDAPSEVVKDLLKSEKTEWHYVRFGNHSAFSDKPLNISGKGNYYKPYFKQGATIVPRNFYFAELSQETPPDGDDRILSVKTARATIVEAKKPWKDFTLKGRIHSKFLFRTALAKNIVPFGLINPPLVILPINITRHRQIRLLNWSDLKKEGELDTACWFKQADELWEKNKTRRSKKMKLADRLDFQKGISTQSLTERYLLLYTASAKNANAVVIDRTKLELHFIAESKTYWFGTDDEDIAYYIACFLNSDYANEIIKDFQTTGLFGPRDIHKRILEIPLPFYDANNAGHRLFAKLGKKCEEKVSGFLSGIGDYNVGRLRLQVRSLLSHELKETDKILKKLI